MRLLAFLLPLLAVSVARAQTTPRQINVLPAVADSVAPHPAGAAWPVPPPATLDEPLAPAGGFAVGLKNGRTFRVADVSVRQSMLGHSFLLLDGQQRLDLREVKYYEDETGHYIRTPLPRGSQEVTLRRDRAGRISLYSALRNQYTGSYPGIPGPAGYGSYGGYGGRYSGYPPSAGSSYRTVRAQQYFSKDNGPVQDLSLNNLGVAMQDHPASTALLVEARRYQHYAVASGFAAGGILLAGLLTTFSARNTSQALSPLVYMALPFMLVPVVAQSKQERNSRQAIALYNQSRP